MQFYFETAVWISVLALGCALVFGFFFYILLSRTRRLSLKTKVLPALILWNVCTVIWFVDDELEHRRQMSIIRPGHGPEGEFGLVGKSFKWIMFAGPSTGLMVVLMCTRRSNEVTDSKANIARNMANDK